MPYRSGNLLWCLAGTAIVLIMLLAGMKLSKSVDARAGWRRRLILAGMFALSWLGLANFSEKTSAQDAPATNPAETATSTATTPPSTSSAPAYPAYSENFAGKTLEQTDAWKHLDATWKMTDSIFIGDRGRFPFTLAEKTQLLRDIDGIYGRLDALRTAGLLTEPQAKMLQLLNADRHNSIFSIPPSDDRFTNWDFNKEHFDLQLKRYEQRIKNLKEAIKAGDINYPILETMYQITTWYETNNDSALIPKEQLQARHKATEELYGIEVKPGITIQAFMTIMETDRKDDYTIDLKVAKTLPDFSPLNGNINFNYSHSDDIVISPQNEDVVKKDVYAPIQEYIDGLVRDKAINAATAKFFYDDIKMCKEIDAAIEERTAASQKQFDAKTPPDDETKRQLEQIACDLRDYNRGSPFAADGKVVTDYIRWAAAWRNISSLAMDLRKRANAAKEYGQYTIGIDLAISKIIGNMMPELTGIAILEWEHLAMAEDFTFSTGLIQSLAQEETIPQAVYEKIAPMIASTIGVLTEKSKKANYYGDVVPSAQQAGEQIKLAEAILSKSKIDSTELEKTSQWKRLSSVWRDGELVISGAKSKFPFFQMGQKLLLNRLAVASYEVKQLKNAKLLEEWEQTLLCDSLKNMAGFVSNYRSFSEGISCYGGAYYDGVPEQIDKQAELFEKYASSGKVNPAVWQKILAAMEQPLRDKWKRLKDSHDENPELISIRDDADEKIKKELKDGIRRYNEEGEFIYQIETILASMSKIKATVAPKKTELAATPEWQAISKAVEQVLPYAQTGEMTFTQRVAIMKSLADCNDSIDRLAAIGMLSSDECNYAQSLVSGLTLVATRSNPSDSNSGNYPPWRDYIYLDSNEANSIVFAVTFLLDKDRGYRDRIVSTNADIMKLHIKILAEIKKMMARDEFYKSDSYKTDDATKIAAQAKIDELILKLNALCPPAPTTNPAAEQN